MLSVILAAAATAAASPAREMHRRAPLGASESWGEIGMCTTCACTTLTAGGALVAALR